MKKWNDIFIFLGVVVALVVIMAFVAMNIGKTIPDTSNSMPAEKVINDTKSK